jgi:hypothetical protein
MPLVLARLAAVLLSAILPVLGQPPARHRDLLLDALRKSDLKQVKQLLAKGADPNAKNSTGWSYLYFASGRAKNSGPMVEALLAAGARVNEVVKVGSGGVFVKVPGVFGSQQGNTVTVSGEVAVSRMAIVKIARLLLENGANPDGMTNGNGGEDAGRTALCQASESVHIDAVEALLKAGEDTNLATSTLRCALFQGYAIAQLNNVSGSQAWAPLMLVSYLGWDDLVELLLQKKANYMVKDSRGASAMTLARSKRFQQIVAAIAQFSLPKPGDTMALRSGAACAATEVDLDQLLQTRSASGIQVVGLRIGTQVQIGEIKVESYKVRFRVVADGRECWTVIDDVQR